jgi:hypothetical protein
MLYYIRQRLLRRAPSCRARGAAVAAMRVSRLLAVFLLFGGGVLYASPDPGRQGDVPENDQYLPLSVGAKWVLRHPRENASITIEVLERDGDGYRVRFTSPWATNDWTLKASDGKRYYMTGYGAGGNMMQLPGETLFFDFTAGEGKKWSNVIGTMTLTAKNRSVNSNSREYRGCVQVKQASKGGDFFYTFAPKVGFVQFGEGKSAFVLDEATSKLNGGEPAEESRPTPHVPTRPRRSRPDGPALTPPAGRSDASVSRPESRRSGRLLVGTTISTYANESETPTNLMKRFQQTIDAGVTYISGAGKWPELEPKKGQYNLDGLNFQVEYAKKHDISISYTLRLIDTVRRDLPAELSRKSWNDRELGARALKLIEAMALRFDGRVKWFMFGNEIDGYFNEHPDEVNDFVALYTQVAGRLKELAPGIQVSSTLMFGGIDTLGGMLKPLGDHFDFFSFTYYPINPDFTVQDPGAPHRDFARMERAAGARKIVLQEIGYPTSSINKSSQEKQAEFYRNVFEQLRVHRDTIVAGSFFLLADLREKFVKDLSAYYGVNAEVFSAFLQTLGMFDGQGRPKTSWSVFQQELQR